MFTSYIALFYKKYVNLLRLYQISGNNAATPFKRVIYGAKYLTLFRMGFFRDSSRIIGEGGGGGGGEEKKDPPS